MNNTLVDAISNLDNDIIERYFKNKELFAKRKNDIRLAIVMKRWVPVVACLVLIISGTFAIIIPGLSKNPGADLNTGNIPNSDNISTEKPNDNISTEKPSDSEMKDEYTLWNEMMVSWDLYNMLLETDDSQELTILVSDSNIESFYDYVYEGKTYTEYVAERKELLNLAGKLVQLRKDGEWLKFGEAAYTEGNYSKELYDKKIAFYGEEIINRFIVDGVFLRDDLENYYSEIKQQERNIYKLLDVIRNEFFRSFAVEHFEVFKEAGYNVELKERVFWLYIAKQDFVNLSVDKSQYRFDILSTELYDPDKPIDS